MTTQEKVNWLYNQLDGVDETDMEKQLDELMSNEGYNAEADEEGDEEMDD